MIRKLTRDDAPRYKELRLLALTTDADVYFARFEDENRRDSYSFAGEISGHAQPFGYIGWFDANEVLRGYVNLSPSYYQKTKHTAEIFNLYVESAYRKKQIARALLSELIRMAKEDGRLETLFLTVMSENLPALKLYESLGFAQYAVKERSIKTDVGYLSEILMRYDLLR